MNEYGAMARDHYRHWRAASYGWPGTDGDDKDTGGDGTGSTQSLPFSAPSPATWPGPGAAATPADGAAGEQP